MLQIYTSNDLEILFNRLLLDIETVEKENLYEPYYILIPNKNIEYWLKQKIAEKKGICMNFEFYFFENGITKIVLPNEQTIHLIDHTFFSLILFQIFLENPEDFESFKTFINTHKSQTGNIYNLSYYVSEIIFSYFYHNPLLIEFFNNKTNEGISKQNSKQYDLLLDQKKLYKKFKKRIEQLNSEQVQKFFLFFDYPWEEATKNLKEKLSVFIFAFQYSNYFYFKLLKTLEQKIDFYYYQLLLYNPKRLKEDMIENSEQKISANNIKLLEEITSQTSTYLDKTTTPKNLLQELQQEFLNRGFTQTLQNYQPKHKDNSIKLIQAPEKKAEIKAVLEDIQKELAYNPELKLNEIAILSPNLETYLPLLRGYLDYLNIPYNIQDPTLHQISYFASAVESVFSILDSLSNQKIAFSNEQILSILENPLFQKTHSINQENILLFYKLIQTLKIYFDDEREPYHSWEVALKRLRAGKFTDQFLNYKNLTIAPYFDFEMNFDFLEKLHSSIIRFIKEVKEIHNLMSDITQNEIESFYNRLDHFFQTHFNIHVYPENYSIEKNSYKEFQNKLYCLKILQILPSAAFLASFFKLSLYRITSKINEYLFQGITISSMQPLRPIPFKKIYILGLNQEDFPGKKTDSHYNLIYEFIDPKLHKRLFNNILSLPNMNMFLFFEIFLSAKDTLVLSFVNKDLQNNKKLYPSYVYTEIKRFLENSELTENCINIPHTLKIKNNKTFNFKFEFYLSFLGNFRKKLNQIKNLNLNYLSNESFFDLIQSTHYNTIEEIYVHKKFQPEIISFPMESNRIPLRDFIEFQEKPIYYYLKKNQLLSDFSTNIEITDFLSTFDLEKSIKQEIIKKIFIELLFNQKTNSLEEIIEQTLTHYKINGLLNYTFLKEKIKENLYILFSNIIQKKGLQNSKQKSEIFEFENLKNIYNKYYKNYLYFNPYMKASEFNLEKELKFSSILLEIPAYPFENYILEGYLQKDMIFDLDHHYLYFFSFYDFESSLLDFFYLLGLKEILKDFDFFYLFFDIKKERIYKKKLIHLISKQKFHDILKEFLQRKILKIYNFYTIENKENFCLQEKKIDFEDILDQKESFLKLIFEEIILLNLQENITKNNGSSQSFV